MDIIRRRSIVLFLVFFLFSTQNYFILSLGTICKPSERTALLSFKHFNDPFDSLSSWSGENCCSWVEIVCSNTTDHVIQLQLQELGLGGELNPSLQELKQLRHLDLSFNDFDGILPEWLYSLTNLQLLDLSYNQLSGPLPDEQLKKLQYLEYLSLRSNSFSGSIPISIGRLTLLTHLDLSRNQLTGCVSESLRNLSKLETLILSYNSLEGNVSEGFFSTLTSLQFIELHSVVLKVSPEWIPPFQLRYAVLRNCGLGPRFPNWLRTQKLLNSLDLSSNGISGTVPTWFWNSSLSILDISGNSIHGKIPSSICYLSFLHDLDLSDNQMNGMIPHCLGDLASISSMNLRSNDFSGTIPPNFTSDQLYKLDLNGNRFEGKIPRIHSPRLTYLDLGNNQFEDKFPFFLEEEILSNSLEILVLRSNKLYGPLKRLHSNSTFSKLKVLDISSNYFTGDLPLEFILGLEAMKQINNVDYRDSIQYPQTSSVVIHKGAQTRLNHTFMLEFRAIDMSNNTFQGTIPRSIGELVWLSMLNLSNNNLNGRIPSSLGNLTRLESLDLSQNKLSGEIPSHITNIQLLSVLNLSHNNLTGPIPHEGQFLTFTNDSFSGNFGLCGLQMSRKCGDDANKTNCRDPIKEKQSYDDSNNPWSFGWEPVVIGYGCGVLIGLVIQYFVFTKAFLYRWFG